MTALHPGHGEAGSFIATTLSLGAMWFAMMSVMMAPVVWPWVTAFDVFNRGATRRARLAGAGAFLGGYGVAWLLYSFAAAAVQARWQGVTTTSVATAAVLIGAGLVQFSALKRACLHHCRNPFSYLLSRWRNGPLPPWRIGFGHGLFCVGCCWAVMATMLVVGMTNLWWMVALTIAAFAEQVWRRGDLARPAIGVALIAAGVAQIA